MNLFFMQIDTESELKIFNCEALLETAYRKMLENVVNSVITPEDLYYSKHVPWIQGVVCGNAHITLKYGLILNKEELSSLEIIINQELQKDLNIISVEVSEGYKGQYKVLYVVPKILTGLNHIISELSKFKVIEESLPFKPHITLCYLKNTSNTESIKDNLSHLVNVNLGLDKIILEPN